MNYLGIDCTQMDDSMLRDLIAADEPRLNRLLAALRPATGSGYNGIWNGRKCRTATFCASRAKRSVTSTSPTTSVISIVYVTADGESTELAAVSATKGLIGVALFTAEKPMPGRIVVQFAGGAYRLKRGILKEEFARGGAMASLLLRYTQVLLTLVGQTAVCNRHHSVDQQLSRWLLLSLDRHASGALTVTHELIAHFLGVRREGITEAARNLQRAGLIANTRGRITVIDRARLEARCCECYRVVRREYDRLLGASPPPARCTPSSTSAGGRYSVRCGRLICTAGSEVAGCRRQCAPLTRRGSTSVRCWRYRWPHRQCPSAEGQLLRVLDRAGPRCLSGPSRGQPPTCPRSF